jgi:formylmethanofuran dehydrogenase subunit B
VLFWLGVRALLRPARGENEIDMAAPGEGETGASEVYHNVTCPFCGLLCDDLEVARTGSTLKVLKNGCGRAIGGFQRKLPEAKPQVRGADVDLKTAIGAAAELVRKSSLPLYGGMASDVGGIRAIMSLADRSGGVIDHALSEGQYRNIKVVQMSGWIMTTLTEARNRTDVFVIVSDVHKLHGRFFDRIVCPEQSMFDDVPKKRDVIFIGENFDTSAAKGNRVGEVINLNCPNDRLTEVLGALHARLRGLPVQTREPAPQKRGGLLSSLLPSKETPSVPEVAGVKLSDIDRVAEKCKAANYSVFVWAPPGLAFAQADLAVLLVSDIVKELNLTTRSAGLSLGGNDGAPSAASCATWQTGFPLRVSFANGKPEYDSYRYSIGRMLADNEGDLLTWVSSFNPDLGPPATKLPTIVLGTPGLRLSQQPTVFIPVGTPGVDHAGCMVRCDNVVSLPLTNLGRAPLPRGADVLAAIEAAL